MRSLLLFVSLSLIPVLVAAQDPANTPVVGPQYSESQTYRQRVFPVTDKKKKQKDTVKTNLESSAVSRNEPVSLAVSVTDIQGKPTTGLLRENFSLFADGQEVEITSLTETNEPVNFIFVIDASPSAAFEKNVVTDKARQLLSHVAQGDRVMVIKFDTNFKIVCKLTDDLKAADRAIGKIEMGNGTALYDLIWHLSEKVIPTMPGRTAVVLFTDGVDTVSRKAKYDTSLAAAENLEAVFYTVYFDTMQTALTMPGSTGRSSALPVNLFPGLKPPDPKQVAQEYAWGINYINDLATMSGGRAVRAETLSGSTTAPFVTIPAEVRIRYVATFSPKGERRIGQRQELKVRIDKPDLLVLARGSHIVR